MFNQEIEKIIRSGGVAIIPTDTIYGLVGLAMNAKTVERVYRLRKRNPEKPFIILISSIEDLNLFNIVLGEEERNTLKRIWPGSVSVVLRCEKEKFSYLHRGIMTLAFRVPGNEKLRALLKKTGPLIAPSANWEGEVPAKNINEAKKYFGDLVDYYDDGGTLESEPSTLISICDGKIKLLRQGAGKLSEEISL